MRPSLLLFSILPFWTFAKAAPVTIIEKGKAYARIYVQGPLLEELPRRRQDHTLEAVDANLRYQIAQDLNYHLQKMSGAKLEVVELEDGNKIGKPAIVLGDHAFQLGAQPQKTTPSEDGFRILAKDGQVLIGGQRRCGMVFINC